MKENILQQIKKHKDYLIIVEGKKDKTSLENLNFKNIFVINETSKSLGEKVEEIQELVGKGKVCILTDFDKKGKQLHLLLKSKLQEIGVRINTTLRETLLKEKISHIEGLSKYLMEK